MLMALIFRGIAFELRFKASPQSKPRWDAAFHYGSLVATVAQGFVLGAFVQGFRVDGRFFAGGSFDWLTPFSVLTAISLVLGYALLGATWLIMKTEGVLQDWARTQARWLMGGVLVCIGIVSLWTPFLEPKIWVRWFSWPNIALLSPVPIVTIWLALWVWRSIDRRAADDAVNFDLVPIGHRDFGRCGDVAAIAHLLGEAAIDALRCRLSPTDFFGHGI